MYTCVCVGGGGQACTWAKQTVLMWHALPHAIPLPVLCYTQVSMAVQAHTP